MINLFAVRLCVQASRIQDRTSHSAEPRQICTYTATVDRLSERHMIGFHEQWAPQTCMVPHPGLLTSFFLNCTSLSQLFFWERQCATAFTEPTWLWIQVWASTLFVPWRKGLQTSASSKSMSMEPVNWSYNWLSYAFKKRCTLGLMVLYCVSTIRNSKFAKQRWLLFIAASDSCDKKLEANAEKRFDNSGIKQTDLTSCQETSNE
jgi:hypothetical protein